MFDNNIWNNSNTNIIITKIVKLDIPKKGI